MGQNAAFFSGINAIKSVQMPRTLGVFPNTCVLHCIPQSEAIPAFGTLQLIHGGEAVSFPDMKVDWASLRLTTSGHVMTVKLLDRRWRWRFTLVSGRYNMRLIDGTVSLAKTPQELASLCLQAMGETSFDVSQLPNEGNPEVDWIYANAAYVLHQLCEDRGCDISLNLDNSVSIVRLGDGAALPINDDLQSPTLTASPPKGPDVVAVITGESQFEARLKLEAVGLDLDGKVKPIDDLSYKPIRNGWAKIADIEKFTDINSETDTRFTEAQLEVARNLAKKTVFKWYLVKKFSDDTLDVPGYGPVDEISQIFPLNKHRLDTQTIVAATDKQVNIPAKVMGKFEQTGSPEPVENSTKKTTEYHGAYTLIPQVGLVKFHDPVIKRNDALDVEPAELYLQTSFGVRKNVTLQQIRYVFDRNITGANAGVLLTEASRVEELSASFQATYDDETDPTVPTGTTDNLQALQQEVDGILNNMALRWTGAVYGFGIYRGIKQFNTDGAIRQVTWYISPAGSHTIASRNSEAAAGPIRELERRRRRLLELSAQSGPYAASRFRRGEDGGTFRAKGYE